MGLRRERERGPSYDALLREFVDACQAEYGRSVLLQFEDFGNQNAFRLMREYQQKVMLWASSLLPTAIQCTQILVLPGGHNLTK